MYDALYPILKRMKVGTNDETKGRRIIGPLVVELCEGRPAPAILDVGAGRGEDLLSVRKALPDATASAVESHPVSVAHLRPAGVEVAEVDIEHERLPFADESFDVVMCNQVLEHVKELFWVVSELSRVCKVGGRLLLGVPNLGSLHNRVALLAGRQPPAIHVFGPHVRGFTREGLRDFLEAGDVLKVERTLGCNFFPFPPAVSRPLARLLPGMAVVSLFVVKKAAADDFLKVFESPRSMELVDTPYYRGVSASVPGAN